MSSRTLSQDLRARIVAAVENGLFQHQVAEKFNVNPAMLYVGPLAATTGQPSFPTLCDGDHLSYQIETKAGRIDALRKRFGNIG